MTRGGQRAAVIAGLVAVALAPHAHAQPTWVYGGDVVGGLMLSEPQKSLFGPGGALSLAAYRSFSPRLMAGVRLRGAALLDGKAPPINDPNPGMGGIGALLLAGRLRPFAKSDNPNRPWDRMSGYWVEGTLGVGVIGSLPRPVAELGLGYGKRFRRTVVSPVLRYFHALQSGAEKSGRDAMIAMVGIEALWGTAPGPVLQEDLQEDRIPDATSRPTEDRIPDARSRSIEDSIPAALVRVRAATNLQLSEAYLQHIDVELEAISKGLAAALAVPPAPRPNAALSAPVAVADQDGDGIPDGKDACPLQAEVINGIDDLDGCPDQGIITMVNDRVVLGEHVLFETDRARVSGHGRKALVAVMQLWTQHPEWERLDVEGHADERGSDAYNQWLSDERAGRVRNMLIELGMPAGKVFSRGYGKTRPRAQGRDDESLRLNRRVELVVLRKPGAAPQPLAGAPRAPPPLSGATHLSPPPARETGAGFAPSLPSAAPQRDSPQHRRVQPVGPASPQSPGYRVPRVRRPTNLAPEDERR